MSWVSNVSELTMFKGLWFDDLWMGRSSLKNWIFYVSTSLDLELKRYLKQRIGSNCSCWIVSIKACCRGQGNEKKVTTNTTFTVINLLHNNGERRDLPSSKTRLLLGGTISAQHTYEQLPTILEKPFSLQMLKTKYVNSCVYLEVWKPILLLNYNYI